MPEEVTGSTSGLFVSPDQPLIGVPVPRNGQIGTRFFASIDEADAALAPQVPDEALQLAGCWGDLPWEAMEQELGQIRHASPPSPPLEV